MRYLVTVVAVASLICLAPLAVFAQADGPPQDSNPSAVDALNPENIEAFAKIAIEAVASKNYMLLAALGVIAAVYLARKLLGSRFPILKTPRAGAILVLLTSIAGAVATALLAGQSIGLALLLQALAVGLSAAGGFRLVKVLITNEAEVEAAKAAAKAAGEAAAKSAPSAPSLAAYVNAGYDANGTPLYRDDE